MFGYSYVVGLSFWLNCFVGLVFVFIFAVPNHLSPHP